MRAVFGWAGAALLLAGHLSQAPAHAAPEPMPPYLSHADDPAQKDFSFILIGFFTHANGGPGGTVTKEEYEREVLHASESFWAYLVAKGRVANEDQAIAYTTEMVQGAARYVAGAPCDPDSSRLVNDGYRLAREFEARNGLNKPR